MQENFCSINYLTLYNILAFVLKYFGTVLSAVYTCVFWKLFFGKYFSALFPLFFRFFLCEASGRWF
jgi:hypothetical protein